MNTLVRITLLALTSIFLAGCPLGDEVFLGDDGAGSAEAAGVQGIWLTEGAGASVAFDDVSGQAEGISGSVLIVARDGESAFLGQNCAAACHAQQNGELFAVEFDEIVDRCSPPPAASAQRLAPGCAYQDAEVSGTAQTYYHLSDNRTVKTWNVAISGSLTQWFAKEDGENLKLIAKEMTLTESGCAVRESLDEDAGGQDPFGYPDPADCPLPDPDPVSLSSGPGDIANCPNVGDYCYLEVTTNYYYYPPLYEIGSSTALTDDIWGNLDGFYADDALFWAFGIMDIDENGNIISESGSGFVTSQISNESCGLTGKITPVDQRYNVYRVSGAANCFRDDGDGYSESEDFTFSGLSVLAPSIPGGIGEVGSAAEVEAPPLDWLFFAVDGTSSYEDVEDNEVVDSDSRETAAAVAYCRGAECAF